ncbi:MAG: HDIG domain-containing metalloprotein [Thermus caldifontis]
MLRPIAHRDFPFYTPKGAIPVGGALRDLLLGKRPWDLDFAAPDPVRAAEEAQGHLGGTLFPLDPERGQYRLVTGKLVLDFSPLEGSLEEDLLKRDFRLNALAWKGGWVWGLKGVEEDLRQKVLVPVREENLYQDHLRSLRAVRLAASLGLGLPGKTRNALSRHARFLRGHPEALPARERVKEELARLLLSPRAAWGLHVLEGVGLLDPYLPELRLLVGLEQGGVHHLDAWRHTLSVVFHLLWLWPEAPLEARLAALFHDVGKPLTRRFDPQVGRFRFLGHAEVGAEMAKAALLWLRFPKEAVEKVEALVRRHMDRLPDEAKALRRFLFRRKDLLPHLVYLMAADRLGTRGVEEEAWGVLEAYQKALSQPLPTRPLLSGEEVMALLSLRPGPLVGKALEALLLAQVEGRVTTPEEARAYLLYWKGHGADTPAGTPDHPY